jgi:hypothetical protein
MIRAVIALCVVAADPASTPRPSVTVVVRGAADKVSPEQLQSLGLPLDFKLTALPNAVAAQNVPANSIGDAIAQARKSYVNADFAKCLKQVDSDEVLTASLVDGDRNAASRLLLWRVACNVGAAKPEPARRAAWEMATYGLELPADVSAVSPEVEAVIAQAFREATAGKTVPITVTAGAETGEVRIDGRRTGCNTPCNMDVLEGNHVVRVDADGSLPSHRLVRVEKPRADVALELSPAPPEVAATQWTARYGQSPDADSAHAMKLLGTALRTSRLLLISLDDGQQAQLKGLLAVDGQVVARSERSELGGLMQDLLVRGQLLEPSAPIWKRPVFWIAIVVAAGAAAATTGILLTRRIDSQVVFQ